MMNDQGNPTTSIQRLVDKYKAEFQRPENIKHYSEQDYAAAQKQYVSYRLKSG